MVVQSGFLFTVGVSRSSFLYRAFQFFQAIGLREREEVVPNESIYLFFEENPKWSTHIEYIVEECMQHRILLDIFDQSVKHFF